MPTSAHSGEDRNAELARNKKSLECHQAIFSFLCGGGCQGTRLDHLRTFAYKWLIGKDRQTRTGSRIFSAEHNLILSLWCCNSLRGAGLSEGRVPAHFSKGARGWLAKVISLVLV